MVKRLFYLVLFVVISVLLAGCGIFDRVDIEITSPPKNFRTTEELPEGTIPYIPVNVIYDGSKASNVAQILIDGTPVGTCILYVGENKCGRYSIDGQGQHNVVVQVQKDNGSLVTDTSTFTWKPYTVAEKTIKFISGDTGNGFLVVVVIGVVLVILFAIRMLKSVNIWSFALLALVVISLVFLAPAMFGGVEALVSIKALQTFLLKVVGGIVTVIVIVAAIKNGYSIGINHTQVRSQGDHGMFEGSHSAAGITSRSSRNESVEGLYALAENVSHGRPSLIESATQGLLGSGIKRTRSTNPGLIARLLFGKKPEIIEYEE